MIVGDEVGDLDRDILARRELAQAVAPTLHAFGVAVDRAAAMVEDEQLVGEDRHQPHRVRRVWRGNSIRSKLRPCAAGARGRRARADRPSCRAGDEAAGRIVVPAQDVADADDAIEGRLRIEEGRARRASPAAHARRSAPRRRPPCRASPASASRRGNRPRPARLDMHGGDDVLAGGIAQIIVGQIVLPERSKVAEPAALGRSRAQPGMPVEAEVPEMMMRIDDRAGIDVHAGSSLTDRRGASDCSEHAKK